MSRAKSNSSRPEDVWQYTPDDYEMGLDRIIDLVTSNNECHEISKLTEVTIKACRAFPFENPNATSETLTQYICDAIEKHFGGADRVELKYKDLQGHSHTLTNALSIYKGVLEHIFLCVVHHNTGRTINDPLFIPVAMIKQFFTDLFYQGLPVGTTNGRNFANVLKGFAKRHGYKVTTDNDTKPSHE